MSTTRATTRRRRSDGERTRRTILETASRLATVEGLEGLSLGRLAQESGMSKSGLFAHFGSKEELQLATVGWAEEVFRAEVVEPALAQPPGLARLRALCDRFLRHVEDAVFPGGCFFASAAAELDTRPGPLRDRIAAITRSWAAMVEECVRDAQAAGELDADADAGQLVFEVNAALAWANGAYVLHGDPEVFARARRAIETRLTP